jgi:hypothetical protein
MTAMGCMRVLHLGQAMTSTENTFRRSWAHGIQRRRMVRPLGLWARRRCGWRDPAGPPRTLQAPPVSATWRSALPNRRALQEVGYPFPDALASLPGGTAPPGATTSRTRPCGFAHPWPRCGTLCATAAASHFSAAPAAAGRLGTLPHPTGMRRQPPFGPLTRRVVSGRSDPWRVGPLGRH